MIMVVMDTNYITDRIRTLIQKYKVGGIILYRKNFATYEDLIQLINELKSLNQYNKIPLTIAIDQEGGRVNRSVIRILKEKEKYNINDNKIIPSIDINQINDRIDKIRKSCNI